MKIIVFGATGGVGQSVVKQALEKGYEITAFVRTPSKLKVEHENLHIIQGDVFNKEEVSKAIAGHDLVVSCLGSNTPIDQPRTELEDMIKNIVDNMKENNIARIIYTASAGIYGEIPGVGGQMVMEQLKHALKDHRNAVDYITTSGLIYTIVRPMGLTNDEFTGVYRETNEGIPENGRIIPRADVAHFIIKAISDKQYENASVALAT